jgi:hypothetical protein
VAPNRADLNMRPSDDYTMSPHGLLTPDRTLGIVLLPLLRLEQRGWITSEWGSSENNRKARFYSITKAGKKQLAAETAGWARTVAMMQRMLGEEG